MRIAFICGEYPPGLHGGIGTWTQVIARRLVASGHIVRVIGISEQSATIRCDVDRGVDVWRIPAHLHRGGWVVDRVALVRTIARWAGAGEVDLVEVPDWQGWAARWPRLPVPVVARFHGCETYFNTEMSRPTRWLTRWIERESLRRADFWCSSSQYIAERTPILFQLPRRPEVVLHNPVECDDASPGVRDNQEVVFAGTLTEKKGVVSLIEAWLHVRRRCPAARLHLFGKDGRTATGESMQSALEARLHRAGDSSVQFHGHQDRRTVGDHLRRCRVAVFPSWVEAFAIAPLEAMARGCPTLVSCRSSGPELVEDGISGLLVDPANPESIASAIVSVLTNDSVAAQLSTGAASRIRATFSLDALFAKNVAFYSQCLDRFAEHRASRTRFSTRSVRDAVSDRGTRRSAARSGVPT